MIFFGMLKRMANRFPDGGAPGLTRNRRYDPVISHPGSEPFHLGRFSAALGAFESDQRHGHDFAAKVGHCRTPHFRLVRLASEGEV